LARYLDQLFPIGRGHLGRASGSGGIEQTLDAFGEITLEPGAYGFIVFAHNLGNFTGDQSFFYRQQDHLSSGAHVDIAGRSVPFIDPSKGCGI